MNQNSLERACEEYCADEDHNGAYGHYLAEQIIKQKEIEELEKMVELENQIIFIKAVDKSRININNKFSNRYEKENLIKKYTPYTRLNGSGDKKESLKDCSDYKIGSAFNNIYYSALNKIEKYGRGK